MSLTPHVLDPAGRDIYGEVEQLRAQGPATLIELPGGVPAWFVTNFGLLKQVLAHPQVSKDAFQHWKILRDGALSQPWLLDLYVMPRNMLTAHGADHTRLRTLVSKAFTRHRVQALRPRIEQITTDLLDALTATPTGHSVDLRAAYADPLPIQVICELFGVPEGQIRDGLRAVADGIFATAASAEEAQANGILMYQVLDALITFKRHNPGEDFTTALINAHDDGAGALSAQELADMLIVMIVAGHKTTTDLLDQAITALLLDHKQYELVRTGRVTWSAVIEETLRCHPPVASFPLRFAAVDLDFPDYPNIHIPAGDAILASYVGAGRDPEVNTNPSEFDATRGAIRHLSFGHGIHHCLGEPLARLEAEIALPALFSRFPELHLAEPEQLQRVESFVLNGHRALPAWLHESQ